MYVYFPFVLVIVHVYLLMEKGDSPYKRFVSDLVVFCFKIIIAVLTFPFSLLKRIMT
jgi:hypothetical protein